MKIIKNNYCGEAAPKQIDKNNSYKVVCDKCDSELEVTKEDAYIGWSGGYYVKCPCCGEETFIPQLDVDKNYTKKQLAFQHIFVKRNTESILVLLLTMKKWNIVK